MENKYRTLENVIRQIHRESVDNRNTELRKKVVNVGRPDTAASNLDPNSKLAKQGEIKTKIIDESYKKKYESAPDHVKKVADDIAWIKKQPTDVLKRHADQTQRVHSAKTRDELRSVILSKHGKKNLEAHDKHFFGEEVEIEEAKKKDDTILVTTKDDPAAKRGGGVKRIPKKDYDPKTQNLAMEAAEEDEEKEKKKDKDKKDVDSADSHEPEKQVTLGKTEVDTDPKTDDTVSDQTKEKQDSDKARKDANKDIGQKTKKLKEESTMLRSDNKFGLPQSLIDTVAEALKGGQKKLDKNHNNKLDKEDFKLLRGEKKMEEEVEQIDEVGDTPAGQKTLKSYIKKASYDALSHGAGYVGSGGDKMHLRKGANRVRGIEKAVDRLKEEEQIDEISGATAGAYLVGSRKDEKARRDKGIEVRDQIRKETGLHVGTPIDRKLHSPTASRSAGQALAVKKLTGKAKVNATEEVEQIDEISKERAGQYTKKAVRRLSYAQSHADSAHSSHADDDAKHYDKIVDKREAGINNAINKLSGKAKVNATEEVQFSPEELAHIEAIMKKED